MKKYLPSLLIFIHLITPVANAYRDQETGTFLTRDPAGFVDGPNQYCYVHNNPITKFDPHGLKAKGTNKKTADIVIKDLEKISSHKLQSDKKGNINLSQTANPKASKTLAGDKLVQRVIGSKRMMEFKLTNGGSTEEDKSPTKALNGKGSDVTVTYNPTATPAVLTVDPKTGKVTSQPTPSQIVLGHEMVHGDRSMRGKAIDYSKMSSHTYVNSAGKTVTQQVPTEELATVGLNYHTASDVTENQIRTEQKVNPRAAY